MTAKRNSRTARPKAMLLPLPAETVRSISLENHLALAAMRSGQGTSDTMIGLLRVLYMTYYLLEAQGYWVGLQAFLDDEAALDESIRGAAVGREWQLSAERLPAIEEVLRRSDEVVGSIYRYVEAWGKLTRFVSADSGKHSPLPGSQLQEART